MHSLNVVKLIACLKSICETDLITKTNLADHWFVMRSRLCERLKEQPYLKYSYPFNHDKRTNLLTQWKKYFKQSLNMKNRTKDQGQFVTHKVWSIQAALGKIKTREDNLCQNVFRSIFDFVVSCVYICLTCKARRVIAVLYNAL